MLNLADHQKENLTQATCTKHAAIGEVAGRIGFEKEIQTVYDCGKIVRSHILKSRASPWQFKGSLADENVLSVLYNLLKWMLGGSYSELSCEFDNIRTNVLHRLCINIAQTIMYEVSPLGKCCISQSQKIIASDTGLQNLKILMC